MDYARQPAPLRHLAPPTVDTTIAQFLEATQVTRSPHTWRLYKSGLKRFCAYLTEEGLPPDQLGAGELPPTIVESYALALLRERGAAKRGTVSTYVQPVRSLVKYWARHGLLAPGVTREQLDRGLSEFLGRAPAYRQRKVDGSAMAGIVRLVDTLVEQHLTPEQWAALPAAEQQRLLAR